MFAYGQMRMPIKEPSYEKLTEAGINMNREQPQRHQSWTSPDGAEKYLRRMYSPRGTIVTYPQNKPADHVTKLMSYSHSFFCSLCSKYVTNVPMDAATKIKVVHIQNGPYLFKIPCNQNDKSTVRDKW